jgi:RNA polymerase sigma factor (TIGR02999 family)
MPAAGRAPSEGGVTDLLRAWSQGDRGAGEALFPLVYADLRRRASRCLRGERRGHTLEPTALVHEAFLRLVDQRRASWQNRAQFFAVAARMMRRVLVDHARGRKAARRGGTWCRVDLDEGAVAAGPRDLDVAALDEALDELGALDERQARIVEVRFFGGLSIEATAEALGLSVKTVKSDWRMARAFLHSRLAGAGAPRG